MSSMYSTPDFKVLDVRLQDTRCPTSKYSTPDFKILDTQLQVTRHSTSRYITPNFKILDVRLRALTCRSCTRLSPMVGTQYSSLTSGGSPNSVLSPRKEVALDKLRCKLSVPQTLNTAAEPAWNPDKQVTEVENGRGNVLNTCRNLCICIYECMFACVYTYICKVCMFVCLVYIDMYVCIYGVCMYISYMCMTSTPYIYIYIYNYYYI